MDSVPVLHWLGIDQWALRVPLPGQPSERVGSLAADAPVFDAPVAGHPKSLVDSSKVNDAEMPLVEPVPSSGLCFVSASENEFSVLVEAISRCLPPGKTAIHQRAMEGQQPLVHCGEQTWSLAELRCNGQAKRALWRLLVGSKA